MLWSNFITLFTKNVIKTTFCVEQFDKTQGQFRFSQQASKDHALQTSHTMKMRNIYVYYQKIICRTKGISERNEGLCFKCLFFLVMTILDMTQKWSTNLSKSNSQKNKQT